MGKMLENASIQWNKQKINFISYLGVLFIYRRQREPKDNVVSVPGHVVRSMAKYDAGPEPELILKVADTADLYNKCFDILDQTVNFKTFHVRKASIRQCPYWFRS